MERNKMTEHTKVDRKITIRTGGARCLNMGGGWDMMQGLLRMRDEKREED